MKVLTAPEIEIVGPANPLEQVEMCAWAARQCYQSLTPEEKDTERMIKMLIYKGHDAMLEHGNFTARVRCDRGVTHEIVRHRHFSYAQESTRFCNYSKDRFGGEITVMLPPTIIGKSPAFEAWAESCLTAEASYLKMLADGVTTDAARSVLPTCLATNIVITGNFRQWRHFFKLRALGVSGKPNPQMKQVASELLQTAKEIFPYVFEDLEVPSDNK